MTTRCCAVFGGIYNNHLALVAVLDDAARRGATEVFCLGDLGGFGPHPDRVFPILHDRGVTVMQGNYDHSIGNQLADCGCGYTDPRDNHYARLSYAYTLAKTSPRWYPYLRDLPAALRTTWGGWRVLMSHGSPRRVNEFLWESASAEAFLAKLLLSYQADVLLVTHTGLPWQRRLPPELGGGLVVNVGAIGRPANDGRTEVWYALVTFSEAPRDADSGAACSTTNEAPARLAHDAAHISAPLCVTFIPVGYDHALLAAEMRAEALPEEFVETIETGYWTTCLEILPARERSRGRY